MLFVERLRFWMISSNSWLPLVWRNLIFDRVNELVNNYRWSFYGLNFLLNLCAVCFRFFLCFALILYCAWLFGKFFEFLWMMSWSLFEFRVFNIFNEASWIYLFDLKLNIYLINLGLWVWALNRHIYIA